MRPRLESLTNEVLPEACSPVVTGEKSIRVETHDLDILEDTAKCSWCAGVVSKQNLQENLSVPDEGCRVEWGSVELRVNEVLHDRHGVKV